MLVGLIAVTLFGMGGVVTFALVSAMVDKSGLKMPEDRVYDRRL